VALQVSEKPRALDGVRLAPGVALDAGLLASVCNPWHELVPLTALERCLLTALDGTHTREDLATHMNEAIRAGRLRVLRDGQTLPENAEAEAFLQQQFAQALHDLRRKGLIVA
jgi:methyltransferase-like protein